jgi:aspartokinase-like uncharacterized kinase
MMSADDIVVVKLGGSLLTMPGLGARLRAWLDALPTRKTILVVGGGAAADAIRALDSVHHFGEEQAHWLAVRAMSLNARVVAQLLPASRFLTALEDCEETWATDCTAIIDPVPVLLGDWGKPGELPRSWSVTSDSIAVRVAQLAGAQALFLLKACDVQGGASWEQRAHAGIVDAWFPKIAMRVPKIELIAFQTEAP